MRYGVRPGELTYDQACSLCALGIRILVRSKHEENNARYWIKLVDNVETLSGLKGADIIYRECGVLTD